MTLHRVAVSVSHCFSGLDSEQNLATCSGIAGFTSRRNNAQSSLNRFGPVPENPPPMCNELSQEVERATAPCLHRHPPAKVQCWNIHCQMWTRVQYSYKISKALKFDTMCTCFFAGLCFTEAAKDCLTLAVASVLGDDNSGFAGREDEGPAKSAESPCSCKHSRPALESASKSVRQHGWVESDAATAHFCKACHSK